MHSYIIIDDIIVGYTKEYIKNGTLVLTKSSTSIDIAVIRSNYSFHKALRGLSHNMRELQQVNGYYLTNLGD